MPSKSNVLVGVCVVEVIRRILTYMKSEEFRATVSSLLENLSTSPGIEPDLIRDAFSTTVLPEPFLVRGHTHPNAAALRSSATLFARSMATILGIRVYSMEMSKSDQRKGLYGRRQWFWAKDTNVNNRRDTCLYDDLRYLCDVDYYMDMPTLLARDVNSRLLYTMVPQTATGSGDDDTTFMFDGNGRLITTITGGGLYKHHIWDYGSDSLKVCSKLFGFVTRCAVYCVERKQVGLNRQLILLTPLRSWGTFSAWLANLLLEGKRLERFNPIVITPDGKFVRFNVQTSEGLMVTTARPNSALCATVKATEDEAIATAARLSPTKLLLPTAVSWLKTADRATAAVLTEYHRTTITVFHPTVYPISEAVRSYSYEPRNFDQDMRPKICAFMSPMVHSAFVPIADAAGERACIEGRIDGQKKPEPKFHPFVLSCMEEFVSLVVGGTILEPADIDVIIDKQRKPAQKISLLKAFLDGPFVRNVVKCFIKAESYPDLKDPRNITTYNSTHRLAMCQFSHSLSEHMKQFQWYCPGMTPLQIATRVSNICADADYVNVNDQHRMDGNITHVLRRLDVMVFMKAFKHHRAGLHDLLKNRCDNDGYMPKGSKFNQGPTHGSGDGDTSVSQTLRAAFCSFLAFRRTRNTNRLYYSPQEAFDALGAHCGDDGLDPNLPPNNFSWAASKVGLVVKSHMVQRGERGVNFLARYYSPEVWFGRLDSMCDVKRQLSKFHTTLRLPDNISGKRKLVEKSLGYAATDGETPVIGELSRRAISLSEFGTHEKVLGIRPWWSKFEDSVQFPNSNEGDWMDSEFTFQFPQFDRELFGAWLLRARLLDDLLSPPLCAEIEPPTKARVPIVVDNDVLPAKALMREKVADDQKSSGSKQGDRARKWKQVERRSKRVPR